MKTVSWLAQAVVTATCLPVAAVAYFAGAWYQSAKTGFRYGRREYDL